MQVCTIDYSNFVGRIGIGRVFSGTLHNGERILVIKNDGSRYQANVKQLFTFEGMGRAEASEVHAGDICAVVGVEDADIGDMFTCRIDPVTLDPIHVEEPTMSVVFAPSTSPLVGQEGNIVGGRQIKERLLREAESNISMNITETEDKTGMEVAGRGVLHLSVLMETMRREGYEFQVGRPQVILKKDERGKKLEPIEQAVVDVPERVRRQGHRDLRLARRRDDRHGAARRRTHLEFKIPTRGVMGLRTRILNATRGEGTLFHHFSEYGPYRGDLGGRQNGSLIAMSTDKSVAFALDALQTRGKLFVGPGVMCYEGMIVGEHAKDGDLVVNVAKAKQLTNMRAASADKGIVLAPPITFTLEEALEYIEDDELVEITPKSIRLRKRLLTENDRKKAGRKLARADGAHQHRHGHAVRQRGLPRRAREPQEPGAARQRGHVRDGRRHLPARAARRAALCRARRRRRFRCCVRRHGHARGAVAVRGARNRAHERRRAADSSAERGGSGSSTTC